MRRRRDSDRSPTRCHSTYSSTISPAGRRRCTGTGCRGDPSALRRHGRVRADTTGVWDVERRDSRITARPLIAVDGGLLILPHLCATAREVFLGRLSDGRLPWPVRDGALRLAIDKYRRHVTRQLERDLDERLTGLGVPHTMNHKENRAATGGIPRLAGGIDAVAADAATGTLWVIEAKHVRRGVSASEIRDRVRSFTDPGGHIDKLLRKTDTIAAHRHEAAALAGGDTGRSWKVASLFVTASIEPAAFTWPRRVPFTTVKMSRSQGLLRLNAAGPDSPLLVGRTTHTRWWSLCSLRNAPGRRRMRNLQTAVVTCRHWQGGVPTLSGRWSDGLPLGLRRYGLPPAYCARVYQPKPLGEPSDTAAADIASRALNGRLTIYAGAGLSFSEPTQLPGARALAGLIASHLKQVVPFEGVDVDDLLAVADQIVSQPRGRPLLRDTVLHVADLLGAEFNFGHEAVAMLALEGGSRVFETNYDDCIERAAHPEHLPTVWSDRDLLHGPAHALLKAHGCALRADSMLITSADLAGTPLWAQSGIGARLGEDTVLFVGIGSVADYVKSRLNAVLAVVGFEHIVLVDPALKRWGGDPPLDWEALLQGLPEDQRSPRGASEFLDAVLRAYTYEMVRRVQVMVAGLTPEHPTRVGVDKVLADLLSKDAVRVLRWLRAASMPRAVGTAVVGAPATTQGLCALGTLLGARWTVALHTDGWASVARNVEEAGATTVGMYLLTLLVTGDVDGPAVARKAGQRIFQAKRDETLPPEADVFVLVAGGYTGSLGPEELALPRGADLDAATGVAQSQLKDLPVNILDDPGRDHLIDGGRGGQIFYLNGPHIAEARSA
jgi:hypothetical protein